MNYLKYFWWTLFIKIMMNLSWTFEHENVHESSEEDFVLFVVDELLMIYDEYDLNFWWTFMLKSTWTVHDQSMNSSWTVHHFFAGITATFSTNLLYDEA